MYSSLESSYTFSEMSYIYPMFPGAQNSLLYSGKIWRYPHFIDRNHVIVQVKYVTKNMLICNIFTLWQVKN